MLFVPGITNSINVQQNYGLLCCVYKSKSNWHPLPYCYDKLLSLNLAGSQPLTWDQKI